MLSNFCNWYVQTEFMHDTFGAELTLLNQCKEKKEISITSFKDFKGLVMSWKDHRTYYPE